MQGVTESSDPIRIRAHHLLCIQGFQGLGYDQEFIQRMGEIVALLSSNTGLEVEIITEADEICENCPNLNEGVCTKDQGSTIKELDVHVINHSLLKENDTMTFKRAIDTINNDLNSADVKFICEGCEWIDKCLFFLRLIH
jgi:uncharacterized protein